MSNQDKPKRLAQRVLTALEDQDRSQLWLSKQSGIPYATLYRNLRATPEQFKLEQLTKIETALGLELGSLAFEVAAVAA